MFDFYSYNNRENWIGFKVDRTEIDNFLKIYLLSSDFLKIFIKILIFKRFSYFCLNEFTLPLEKEILFWKEI